MSLTTQTGPASASPHKQRPAVTLGQVLEAVEQDQQVVPLGRVAGQVVDEARDTGGVVQAEVVDGGRVWRAGQQAVRVDDLLGEVAVHL